ncbi:metallophosphoesterase family protein [Planctomycetota bacterium]
MGDAHIGHVSDDRDGGDWLLMSVEDVAQNIGGIDYAVNIGDLTHQSLDGQLNTYVKIREGSGIDRWYEMSGNHDMKSVARGAFADIGGCARYWSLIDGNMAFFSLPAERGNAAGLFVPEVDSWLREVIAPHEDKNIIICAHQFPYDTVDRSTRPERCLYPKSAVHQFLNDVRIDLWLGGHIHSGPRTREATVTRGSTTFINVASVSHTYGTEVCNSFVLDIEHESWQIGARCRDHDHQSFVDDQELRVGLTHMIRLDESEPVFTLYDLDVPDFYRDIHEEQVEDFEAFRHAG